MSATVHSGFQLQTDWRESMKLFGLLMGSVAALSYGMMKGAVAANYAVSGAPMKVMIGDAQVSRMVAYPDTATDSGNKRHAVMLSGMDHVTAKNVCMSLSAPTPFGDVGFRLDAASKGTPLTITDSVSEATGVDGGAGTLHDAEIGKDASKLGGVNGPDGSPVTGPKGRAGIQAGKTTVKNMKASAIHGSAGTLSFNDSKINLGFTGVKQCY